MKAKLNLDRFEFIITDVLNKKYTYDLPSETPSMFLNFIRMFNKPLKELEMPEILQHNINRIQRLRNNKNKVCCYHLCLSPHFLFYFVLKKG